MVNISHLLRVYIIWSKNNKFCIKFIFDHLLEMLPFSNGLLLLRSQRNGSWSQMTLKKSLNLQQILRIDEQIEIIPLLLFYIITEAISIYNSIANRYLTIYHSVFYIRFCLFPQSLSIIKIPACGTINERMNIQSDPLKQRMHTTLIRTSLSLHMHIYIKH